ncbi:MAG: DUF3857 domain-containing protein [Pseudomonadota bacterium]
MQFSRVFAGMTAFIMIMAGDQALAQEGKAEIAPVPSWVELADAPDPALVSVDDAVDGTIAVIFDAQRMKTDQGYDFYGRYAELVTSRAGLEEAGRLSLSYDPLDEELVLHDVTVWRDGKPYDRLEGLDLQFARQEEDLDRGIVDGQMTAFAELQDIRVGDIVDISHSLRVRTPLWSDALFYDFSVRFSVPSGYGRRRILVPGNMDLTINSLGEARDMTVRKLGNMTEYVWEATGLPIYDFENHVPIDYPEGGLISVSSYNSWSDVAAWATEIYDMDLELPAALLEEMNALEGRSTEEKITFAIRHVQDNVRYVSDAVGLGAFKPRPPKLTAERGYGDCKDKALLLTAMLRRMGVDAVPALVHTDDGDALDQYAPSPVQFDHVVVRINWKGDPVYIDATWQLQGGVFPDIQSPRHGWALPIQQGATLEKISDGPLEEVGFLVTEKYVFDDEYNIQFTVETVRKDYTADNFRIDLSETSVRKMSDNYHDWYLKRYPGLELDNVIVVEDDRDENILTTLESYSLSAEHFTAEGLNTDFSYSAYAANYDLPEIIGRDRRAPIAIPHPIHTVHEVIVENAGPHQGMEDLDHSVGPLSVSFKTVEDGERLHMRWAIRTKDRTIAAEDAKAYEKARREFDEHLYITWNFGDLGADVEPSWSEVLMDAFLGRQ